MHGHRYPNASELIKDYVELDERSSAGRETLVAIDCEMVLSANGKELVRDLLPWSLAVHRCPWRRGFPKHSLPQEATLHPWPPSHAPPLASPTPQAVTRPS